MKRQQQKGFTIVELLIVVVVIAILAAITIVSYNGIKVRAQNAATTQAIADTYKSVALFDAENGRFPLTTAELATTGIRINKTAFFGGTNTFVYCYLPDGSQAAFVAAGVGGSANGALWSYSSNGGLKTMTSTEWGSSPAQRCQSALGAVASSHSGLTATNFWVSWTNAY
jgi:prepilin-type N-terminal cleavage/methylation domain-containing protein